MQIIWRENNKHALVYIQYFSNFLFHQKNKILDITLITSHLTKRLKFGLGW